MTKVYVHCFIFEKFGIAIVKLTMTNGTTDIVLIAELIHSIVIFSNTVKNAIRLVSFHWKYFWLAFLPIFLVEVSPSPSFLTTFLFHFTATTVRLVFCTFFFHSFLKIPKWTFFILSKRCVDLKSTPSNIICYNGACVSLRLVCYVFLVWWMQLQMCFPLFFSTTNKIANNFNFIIYFFAISICGVSVPVCVCEKLWCMRQFANKTRFRWAHMNQHHKKKKNWNKSWKQKIGRNCAIVH